MIFLRFQIEKRKSKEEYLVTCKNYKKFTFHYPKIKFYGDNSHTHSFMDYLWLLSCSRAELNSCNGDPVAHKT